MVLFVIAWTTCTAIISLTAEEIVEGMQACWWGYYHDESGRRGGGSVRREI